MYSIRTQVLRFYPWDLYISATTYITQNLLITSTVMGNIIKKLTYPKLIQKFPKCSWFIINIDFDSSSSHCTACGHTVYIIILL